VTATDEERVVKWKQLWDESVMKQKGLVVVEFSSWYPSCKAIGELHAELSDKASYENVTFCKIDVEDCELFSAQASNAPDSNELEELGLKTVVYPTFRFFKEGKKVAEVIGAKPAEFTTTLATISS